MMYLAIIFVSPVYFLARGKWGGFLLNSTLYGMGLILLISIIGAIIAPLFWILAVGHAFWHLRKEIMEEQATMIASKMAEAMGAGTGFSQTAGRD